MPKKNYGTTKRVQIDGVQMDVQLIQEGENVKYRVDAPPGIVLLKVGTPKPVKSIIVDDLSRDRRHSNCLHGWHMLPDLQNVHLLHGKTFNRLKAEGLIPADLEQPPLTRKLLADLAQNTQPHENYAAPVAAPVVAPEPEPAPAPQPRIEYGPDDALVKTLRRLNEMPGSSIRIFDMPDGLRGTYHVVVRKGVIAQATHIERMVVDVLLLRGFINWNTYNALVITNEGKELLKKLNLGD